VNSAKVIGDEGDNRTGFGQTEEKTFVEGIRQINLESDKKMTEMMQQDVEPPDKENDKAIEAAEAAVAERKLDLEKHQAMLDAVRCRIARKKRRTHLEKLSGTERQSGTTDEQAQKRATLQPEEDTRLDSQIQNCPQIIYPPNGNAEWSQRQERRIWRAVLEEAQEAKDEEEVKRMYAAEISKGIAEKGQEGQKYEETKGRRLRHCYGELLKRLQKDQLPGTEQIEGVEMPILTVSDWCRSTHPINIDGVLMSAEDRKALAETDEEDD
jgi:hypothetical protein